MPEARVVIMGGGGVGKSALTLQFVSNRFIDYYDPTIEETYRKPVVIDGQHCTVEILDTAGTEQFMALKEIYMRSGQGFVLVFSLTQLQSVNELGPLREQIIRIKDQKVPMVLIGNKVDLRNERQVPREIGINLSRAWGNVPYYEASARKRINVDEIFADMVRQIRAFEAANPKRQNGSQNNGNTNGRHARNGSGNSRDQRKNRDRKKCVVM